MIELHVEFTTFFICFMILTSCKAGSYERMPHYTEAHRGLHRTLQKTLHTKFHDFEIVIPEVLDDLGNHVSHDLRLHRVRRSSSVDTKYRPTFFGVKTSEENFQVALLPNGNLLAPSFAVKRRRRGAGQTREDDFVNAPSDCHYRGKMISHEHRPTAISLCHGASGLLRTKDDDFIIEPVPKGVHHDFPHPKHPHIVYKKKHILRDKEHYCGQPGTHPTSVFSSENVEFRYLSDGSFVIKPMSDLLKHSEAEADAKILHKRRVKRGTLSASERRKRKVIETLVVADQEMLKKRKSDHTDITTYILTVMNMVGVLFRDGTLDTEIDVTLIGLVLLEDEEIKIGHQASKSLANFCHWQTKVNTTTGRKPDHSILLTGVNICVDKDEPCDTLGLAEVGGMCSLSDSCTINEDTGLGLAFTVAHETGHSLGMTHDGQGNTCSGGDGHIMSPTINALNGVFTWSSCSRRSLEDFLKTDQARCLDNALTEFSNFDLPRELPGQLYSADDQCRLQFGRERNLCHSRYVDDKDYLCKSLWCQKSDGSCETKHLPASEGTNCGQHKWCRRGECVAIGSGGPKPVNGGWSGYGNWSECSRTCGVGVATKLRQCNNPQPMYGGRYCEGNDRIYQLCNTFNCPPTSLDYRSEQCAEYNTKPYRHQYFNWLPYTKYWKYGTNRCELLCEAEGFGFFDRLSLRVKDGTSCDRDSNDVCIAGKCEQVGCDYVLHSNATNDLCGICDGDNSTCNFISGAFREKVPDSDYYVVTTLPLGAATITIREETCCTHTYIAVRSAADPSRYYLNGDWKVDMQGQMRFGGVKWEYQRKLLQPEVLTAIGPIEESLVIEALIMSENPGISYSYYLGEVDNALPWDTIEKESEKSGPTFSWHEEFSACTKSCAGGSQESVITCVENGDTTVAKSFCEGLSSPPSLMRVCNTEACPARWIIGEWSKCSETCGNGSQTRDVLCTKTTTAGEERIPFDLCDPISKPADHRSCILNQCPPQWKTGRWSKCSKTCGRGKRVRAVTCQLGTLTVPSDSCRLQTRPKSKRGCRVTKCRRMYRWIITAWGECSATCGKGVQKRKVKCGRRTQSGGFKAVKRKRCKRHEKPKVSRRRPCNERSCFPAVNATVVTGNRINIFGKNNTGGRKPQAVDLEPKWITSNWGQCSLTCGGGVQYRSSRCMAGNSSSNRCSDRNKPISARPCNSYLCPANVTKDEFCVDRFAWCYLVPYHRTCGHVYFGSQCCKSCSSADKDGA